MMDRWKHRYKDKREEWGEKFREAFFKKHDREARKARQEADEGDHSSDKDKA